jgi:hypothetical protein
MWRKVAARERPALLKSAIEFTGDAKKYGLFMMRIVSEWPISCEHNLTEKSANRLAWIGHAAAALAINCPEDITREAWAYLDQQQQDDANAQAQNALNTWGRTYERKNSRAHSSVGAARIPGWHTGRSASGAGVSQQSAQLSLDL